MTDRTLDRAVEQTIHSKLLEVHTMLPAKILSFDEELQTVDVEIEIQRNYHGKVQTISTLKDVPIEYPRAGGYIITFPIKPGDQCKLSFCDRSIDNWLLDAGTVDPKDSRAHSLSDAVACVGLWDRTNPIKDYNTEEPEFRTEDGLKKVWLSDDGWVEMVNLDLDTRVVLKDNGDVRVANDKKKTMLEIFESTKIKMHNPLSSATYSPLGNILHKNPLTSREMHELGDIKDKTVLAKHYLRKTGEKYFKNLIAKQITKASGKIEYRCLLNKLELSPSGKARLGNQLNKLTIGLKRAKLGNALNKLDIGSLTSSLGNPLAKLRVLPSTVMLQDAGGIVTPKLVSVLTSAVLSLAQDAGFPEIISPIEQAITGELANIAQLVAGLPDDDPDEDDPFDTVRTQITETLLDMNVDINSEDAINMLKKSDSLDNSWDDVVFDNLLTQINEIPYNG